MRQRYQPGLLLLTLALLLVLPGCQSEPKGTPIALSSSVEKTVRESVGHRIAKPLLTEEELEHWVKFKSWWAMLREPEVQDDPGKTLYCLSKIEEFELTDDISNKLRGKVIDQGRKEFVRYKAFALYSLQDWDGAQKYYAEERALATGSIIGLKEAICLIHLGRADELQDEGTDLMAKGVAQYVRGEKVKGTETLKKAKKRWLKKLGKESYNSLLDATQLDQAPPEVREALKSADII